MSDRVKKKPSQCKEGEEHRFTLVATVHLFYFAIGAIIVCITTQPYSKTNSSVVSRLFRIRQSKAWDPFARQITLDRTESTTLPTHLPWKSC